MAHVPLEPSSSFTLPRGKDFHVYFLYKPVVPDKDIVIKLSKKLKTMGYRCCYQDEDSVAGSLVISNFWRLLKSSMKVVVVFSRAFLDSSWAEYEVAVTMSLAMECSIRVIPITIDGSEIPLEISAYMHHLDITRPEEQWLKRFTHAVADDMDELCEKFNRMLQDDSHLIGVTQTGECGPWESMKLPCIRYDTGRICEKMDYPHVCRNFIIHDACSTENCPLSHDLLNDQSKEMLQKMGFDVEKPLEQLVHAYRKACKEMLKRLPYNRVTGPCSYYNNANRECLDSSGGKLCPFSHICIRWFQGKCEFTKETCPFKHDFTDPNTRKLLEIFNIDPSMSEDEILRTYRAKYGNQQS